MATHKIRIKYTLNTYVLIVLVLLTHNTIYGQENYKDICYHKEFSIQWNLAGNEEKKKILKQYLYNCIGKENIHTVEDNAAIFYTVMNTYKKTEDSLLQNIIEYYFVIGFSLHEEAAEKFISEHYFNNLFVKQEMTILNIGRLYKIIFMIKGNTFMPIQKQLLYLSCLDKQEYITNKIKKKKEETIKDTTILYNNIYTYIYHNHMVNYNNPIFFFIIHKEVFENYQLSINNMMINTFKYYDIEYLKNNFTKEQIVRLYFTLLYTNTEKVKVLNFSRKENYSHHLLKVCIAALLAK